MLSFLFLFFGFFLPDVYFMEQLHPSAAKYILNGDIL